MGLCRLCRIIPFLNMPRLKYFSETLKVYRDRILSKKIRVAVYRHILEDTPPAPSLKHQPGFDELQESSMTCELCGLINICVSASSLA